MFIFFTYYNLGDLMNFAVNDLVTRNSYNNDIVFQIIKIKDNIAFLKGYEVRLLSDSPLDDLKMYVKEDRFVEEDIEFDDLDRGNFFYLLPKILHIDSDDAYLKRCLKFYKKNKVMAVGKNIAEKDISFKIYDLLKEYNPDIVIITGHDAYYKKKGNINDIDNYRNSKYFVDAVKKARKYEKSHEKLVIIAGACQSDYEELIKAGANYASSPKRINIHALDPSIIAITLALTNRNKEVDILNMLKKTKYGSDGFGGLVTNGLMYVGYPR